jgi:hypothetical protein
VLKKKKEEEEEKAQEKNKKRSLPCIYAKQPSSETPGNADSRF